MSIRCFPLSILLFMLVLSGCSQRGGQGADRGKAEPEAVPAYSLEDVTHYQYDDGVLRLKVNFDRGAYYDDRQWHNVLNVLDVEFKRINYVEDVRRKVYDRMIAERRRIADRYRSEGDGEAARILKRGCDGVIQKPFSIDRLSRIIHSVLKSDPDATQTGPAALEQAPRPSEVIPFRPKDQKIN